MFRSLFNKKTPTILLKLYSRMTMFLILQKEVNNSNEGKTIGTRKGQYDIFVPIRCFVMFQTIGILK